MLICRENKSYKCKKIGIGHTYNTVLLRFTIESPFSPDDAAELFGDGAFYFYDDILKARMPYTENAEPKSVSISYNADLSCEVKIKLSIKEGTKT